MRPAYSYSGLASFDLGRDAFVDKPGGSSSGDSSGNALRAAIAGHQLPAVREKLQEINALCETGTELLRKGKHALAGKYLKEALDICKTCQVRQTCALRSGGAVEHVAEGREWR